MDAGGEGAAEALSEEKGEHGDRGELPQRVRPLRLRRPRGDDGARASHRLLDEPDEDTREDEEREGGGEADDGVGESGSAHRYQQHRAPAQRAVREQAEDDPTDDLRG